MDLQRLLDTFLSFLSKDWKIILILTTVFALYYYYTATFDFFKKKGISYMKPVILLGNLGPRLKATRSFHDYQMDIYNYFKGKRYGGKPFFLLLPRHLSYPALINCVFPLPGLQIQVGR